MEEELRGGFSRRLPERFDARLLKIRFEPVGQRLPVMVRDGGVKVMFKVVQVIERDQLHDSTAE